MSETGVGKEKLYHNILYHDIFSSQGKFCENPIRQAGIFRRTEKRTTQKNAQCGCMYHFLPTKRVPTGLPSRMS